jgi:hypothetical protein
MSLMELAVACGSGIAREQVGVVASRDRRHFDTGNDDSKPTPTRLQIEFYTQGDKNLGNDKGGWHGHATGFVPMRGVPYGAGAAFAQQSVIGGPTYDSFFGIRNVGGNWWIIHNQHWLGYYPAHLFDVIGSEACEVHIYGEVFDPTPEVWCATDMGSGKFAAGGRGQAAYFRQPRYVDSAGMQRVPDGTQESPPYDPACYTRSILLDEGPLFDPVMYASGPGGDSPGCN